MLGVGIARISPPVTLDAPAPWFTGRMAVDGLVREGGDGGGFRDLRTDREIQSSAAVAVDPIPAVRVSPVTAIAQILPPVPKPGPVVPETPADKIFGMDQKTFLIVAGVGAAALFFLGKRQ